MLLGWYHVLGFELKYWLVLPWWLPVGLCGTQSRVMQLVGITSSQKATVFRIHKPWRHMPILLCKCWQRKVALAQKKITDSSEWCSIMTSCDSQLLPDQRSSSPCHCWCSQHSQAPAVGWPSAYCFVCWHFQLWNWGDSRRSHNKPLWHLHDGSAEVQRQLCG